MPLRLVNFLPAGLDGPQVGAWTEAGIVDLAATARAAGSALADRFTDVVAVLCDLDLLAAARELAVGGPAVDRESIRLLPPSPRPGKFFLLAGNYLAHIEESQTGTLKTAMEQEWRGGPRVFMKPSVDTLIGDRDPVLLPRTAVFLDYEAELGVIIGQSARHVAPENALEYVAGITAINDISERELAAWDRGDLTEKYKWFDWLNGKWYDTGAPCGPCAVPLADVPDLDDLRLRLYLNGEVLQEANTGQMIFKVPDVVAYISSICTLRPGDLIALGTPSGVGYARNVRLQPGDEMVVELELVGRLSNPVQAEES